MPRGSSLYLQDIVDNAQQIAQALDGVSFEQYAASRVLQAAVERFIEVIGEAAKHVPDEVKARYPADWKLAARMRDVLAHDYPSVVPRIIWDAARTDVKCLAVIAAQALKAGAE